MRVLVVNAGSSSLKLRLLDAQDTIEQSATTEPGDRSMPLVRITQPTPIARMP